MSNMNLLPTLSYTNYIQHCPHKSNPTKFEKHILPSYKTNIGCIQG